MGEKGETTEAVSPVIGVILMVAITVTLAAVVGTYVLGTGSNVSETAQASVQSTQNPDSLRITVVDTGNLDDAQIVGPDGGNSMGFEESLGVGTRVIIDRRGFNNSDVNVTPLESGSDALSELQTDVGSGENDLVGDEDCLIRHGEDVVYGTEINGADIGCSGERL